MIFEVFRLPKCGFNAPGSASVSFVCSWLMPRTRPIEPCSRHGSSSPKVQCIIANSSSSSYLKTLAKEVAP